MVAFLIDFLQNSETMALASSIGEAEAISSEKFYRFYLFYSPNAVTFKSYKKQLLTF